MNKKIGIIKRLTALLLIFLLSINSFAAVVSDNDGSAFITKAEFDSLKNNFQSQIDTYNQSIDSKIDGAIASYLSGIQIKQEMILNTCLDGTDRKVAFVKGVDKSVYTWWAGPKVYNTSSNYRVGLVGDKSKGFLSKSWPNIGCYLSSIGPFGSSSGLQMCAALDQASSSSWNATNDYKTALKGFSVYSSASINLDGWRVGSSDELGDIQVGVVLDAAPNPSGGRFFWPDGYCMAYWQMQRGGFAYWDEVLGQDGFKSQNYLPAYNSYFAVPWLNVGDNLNVETLENSEWKYFYQHKTDRVIGRGKMKVIKIILNWMPSYMEMNDNVRTSGAAPPTNVYEDEAGYYNEGYLEGTVGMFDGLDMKVTEIVDYALPNTALYYVDSGDNNARKYKLEFQLQPSEDWVSAYAVNKFGVYTKPHEGFPLYTLEKKGKIRWTMSVPSGYKYSIRMSPHSKSATSLQNSDVFAESSDNIVYTGTGSFKTFTTKDLDVGTTIYIKMLNDSYDTPASITFGDTVSLILE